MTLRIVDTEEAVWRQEWLFPARARFMGSQAFDILKRDLERYARDEVRGRSFLIAGHRGIGKTTLILRAIEDVGRQAIDDALEQIDDPTSALSTRLRRFQRPLLVKLHGPSLLSDGLPTPGGEAMGAAASCGDGNGEKAAHAVLVHLTIALYRALAREVAHAFAAHAREECRRRPQGDQLELAGQLTLELDRAPDPALLRSYWDRLGRLRTGVLWPAKVGAAQADQGIREIVAVATAAQAFQVCSGAVKYTQSEKQAAAREAMAEAKGESNLKDAANTLFGLAAGGAVGVAAYQAFGPVSGALAGLATGMVSSLTLGWAGKRSTKSERTLDYTFIVDRSIQTLDRDLPLVIERIRDAGLTPVFVIDELDKVRQCDETIDRLFMRLKHLVTDFGFFCFLTDRDYYEHLHRRLRGKAFPVEHTYFSNWLCVLNQPGDLRTYLTDILRPGRDPADPLAPEDALAVWFLARFIIHRSKLNTADVHRELARQCDGQGWLRVKPDEVRGQLYYRIPVMIQLAIDHLLEGDGLRSRVLRDPSFAQLAVDALYKLSRVWEAGRPDVSVGRKALASYLLQRQGVAVVGGDEESEIERIIGATDWELLIGLVRQLSALLSDPAELGRALLAQPYLEPVERAFLDGLFNPVTLRLIEPVAEDAERYRFVYDAYGRNWETKAAVASAPELPEEVAREIQYLIGISRIFMKTLDGIGITLPEFVARGLLPGTVVADALEATMVRLGAAVRAGHSYGELPADLPALKDFVEAFTARGALITQRLVIGLSLVTDLGGLPAVALSSALDAQDRYFSLPSVSEEEQGDVIEVPGGLLTATYDSMPPHARFWRREDLRLTHIGRWRGWILGMRRDAGKARPRPTLNALARHAWGLWEQALPVWLLRRRSLERTFCYDDLLLAAAGRPPGNSFRHDMERVSVADWSLMCAMAFPGSGGGSDEDVVPLWMLVAALFALGFGSDVLAEAVRLVRWGPHPELVNAAPRVAPGILMIMREEVGSVADDPAWRGDNPVLALRRDHIVQYAPFIRWMYGLGAIKGVADEQ